MGTCHQCGATIGTFKGRSGPCSFCLQKKVTFCKDCAFWELGPLPASSGLPSNVRSKKKTSDVVTACPIELGRRRQTLLDELRDECDMLKAQLDGADQLYGQGFRALVEQALGYYDTLYGTRQSEAWNRMMHTIITVYLSSQLRCLAPADRKVHLWDAPRVAKKHLSTCFSKDPYIPADMRVRAQEGSRLVAVEQMLRHKMSPAVARRKILAVAGDNPGDAQQILIINIMLFHTWTQVLSSPEVSEDARNFFYPTQAYGWWSDDIRTELYGGKAAPAPFTSKVEGQLGGLYVSLSKTDAPAPPRFPDNDVQALVGGLINARQAEYLQSLPKMDTADAAQRQACEKHVRKKVETRLKKYLKSIDLYNPAYHDTAVLDTYRWRDDLVDDLIAKMRAQFYIEQATRDRLLTAVADALQAGNVCTVLSDARRSRIDVPWSEVFHVNCNADGQFLGIDHHPDDLRTATDGRERAPHYMHWRNDKDNFMYDCMDLSPADDMAIDNRPVFTSLAVSPNLPEIKTGYGCHLIIWQNDVLSRAVVSIGDLGIPRRSMLLLLRDVLYPLPRKDGSGNNVAPEPRRTLLNTILHRAVTAPGTALTEGNFRTHIGGLQYERQDSHNLEVHVFGDLAPAQHARVIALAIDGADNTFFNRLNGLRPGDAPWELFTFDKADLDARREKIGLPLLQLGTKTRALLPAPLNEAGEGYPARDEQVKVLKPAT